MPNAPYARVRASIAGGPPQTGGIVAAAGATCQFTADPGGLSGAFLLRWEVLDYPTGWTLPSGWTVDSNGVYFFVGATPPIVTLPDAAHWGKLMPRLTLNNGISENPEVLPIEQLSDTSTAISILSPAGLKDLGFNEEEQFSALKLWTKDHKDNLRILDTFIIDGGGGSGLVVTGSPALNYDVAWNGSGAVWAPDVDGWINTLNHTTRDAIPTAFTPVGTLVRTLNDGIVWEVTSVGPVVYSLFQGPGYLALAPTDVVAPTTLHTSPPAGLYLAACYLTIKTAGIAGKIRGNVNFTDPSGVAQSAALTGPLDISIVGNAGGGSVPIVPNGSTNIQISVTSLAGTFTKGALAYDVRFSVKP